MTATKKKTRAVVIDEHQENFTVREAAAFLRISPSAIYKCVAGGILKPARFGAKMIFTRAILDSFIEGARKKPVIIPQPAGVD